MFHGRLQLLSGLLSKWPSSLPPEESTPLLVQLHKMQAEAKRWGIRRTIVLYSIWADEMVPL